MALRLECRALTISKESKMSTSERLEAIGPNGEACIVVRTGAEINTSNLVGRGSLKALYSYRLATGERLNPTSDPMVFETLHKVPYRLRLPVKADS